MFRTLTSPVWMLALALALGMVLPRWMPAASALCVSDCCQTGSAPAPTATESCGTCCEHTDTAAERPAPGTPTDHPDHQGPCKGACDCTLCSCVSGKVTPARIAPATSCGSAAPPIVLHDHLHAPCRVARGCDLLRPPRA